MKYTVAKPNFTQTPNDLFDLWMRDLSNNALRVMLVITRKTFGWHKTIDAISQSQIQEMSGLCRNAVKSGLKELIELGIIAKSQTQKEGGLWSTAVYGIRFGGSPDDKGVGHAMTEGGSPDDLGGGSPDDPTKEIVKETIQNKQIQRATPAKTPANTDAVAVVDHYNNVFKKRIKLTSPRLTKIRATLKDYTVEQVNNAISGMANDEWTKKTGRTEIERIIESDKRDANIEKFGGLKTRPKYDFEIENEKFIEKMRGKN